MLDTTEPNTTVSVLNQPPYQNIMKITIVIFFLFGTIICKNNTDIKPKTIKENHLGKDIKYK